MILRMMEEKDLDQVDVIEHVLFTDPWTKEGFRESLTRPEACFIVAADGDRICGYCGCYYALDEGEIVNVAVAPDSQRLGIGSQLVSALIELMLKKGVTNYILEVRASNTPALALYKSLGFEKIGIRKRFYDQPVEDAVIMQRLIDKS